jgi:predicted dehydrogenase
MSTERNHVRWGVIGAGDVCERKSGPPLYQVEGSRLVLVHRRDAPAGEEFTRRHAGRYVANLDELLSSPEIDAVYVASPHALHAEHTIAAIEAGKHVLVEKPMALNQDDCTAMIQAAAGAGRSLAVAYYRRGYPSIRRIKALLEEDTIGQVTALSINNEFPTSHRLDLVHYLLGDVAEIRTVPGGSEGYRFERPAGRIELHTAGAAGVPVTITMADTWTETGMPESLLITGERGRIHLSDLKRGALTVIHGDRQEYLDTGGLPFTHTGLIENVVAHLTGGVPLLCDGIEGRKSTVLLDALAGAEPEQWTRVDYG